MDGGFAYSYGAILSNPTGYLESAQSPDVKPTLPYVSTLGRVPSLSFTGGTALGSYGPYRDYNRDRNPYANVTYILGNHSLRAGATYHYYQKSENAAGSNAGSFGFTNTGVRIQLPARRLLVPSTSRGPGSCWVSRLRSRRLRSI